MNQCTQVESGMTFRYNPDEVFLPELSPTYKALSKRNGIKSCDFIWLDRRKRLLFIEVKTTAPEQEQRLETYIQQIHVKLIHSLLLYIGIMIGRPFQEQTILPAGLSAIKLDEIPIVPVLIVQKHQKDWLAPLTDSIRKKMRGTQKAYCLKDILVINEEFARKQGFIT